MGSRLGERIRIRRKELGLTLKDVAGEMVTAAQISAVERGKCNPSSKLLKYIAERLDCNVEELRMSSEEKFRIDFKKISKRVQKLYDEKKYFDAIENLDNAKSRFDCLTDWQKGYFYFLKGECFYELKKYTDSFVLYVKALTYYLKTDDKLYICNANKKIGNCFLLTKKYELAIGYYMNALNHADEGIEPKITAGILYNLSLCYIYMERYDQSKYYIERCINYSKQYDWAEKDKLVAGLHMMKGVLSKELCKDREGLEMFNNAFERYGEGIDLEGMGRCKNNSALCLWNMNMKEDAEKCFKEAIEYKLKCNDLTLGTSYINLADLYMDMGNEEKAIETIDEAEEHILRQANSDSIIEVFIKKFEYLTMKGNYSRAEIVALFALDYIQKANYTDTELKLYILLSDMYKKIGDENTAIEYLIKANSFIK